MFRLHLGIRALLLDVDGDDCAGVHGRVDERSALELGRRWRARAVPYCSGKKSTDNSNLS
jgi:hypothetical protein